VTELRRRRLEPVLSTESTINGLTCSFVVLVLFAMLSAISEVMAPTMASLRPPSGRSMVKLILTVPAGTGTGDTITELDEDDEEELLELDDEDDAVEEEEAVDDEEEEEEEVDDDDDDDDEEEEESELELDEDAVLDDDDTMTTLEDESLAALDEDDTMTTLDELRSPPDDDDETTMTDELERSDSPEEELSKISDDEDNIESPELELRPLDRDRSLDKMSKSKSKSKSSAPTKFAENSTIEKSAQSAIIVRDTIATHKIGLCLHNITNVLTSVDGCENDLNSEQVDLNRI
jgi:hypothetical protein